ncbi:MAG: hypothetical protein FJ215_01795 [Ignavibacteria bacterium]|nr:hypothetical protein [Ignavibacteria bacterium]
MFKRFAMMLCVVGMVIPVRAQQGEIGVGLMVGAPTGLTGKYLLSNSENAIQGFLGGGFGGISVGGDYLYYTDAFDHPDFPFYVGPGAFIGPSAVGGPSFDRTGTLGLGVRGIFGVSYFFPRHPFEISFEIGPVLYVSPAVDMGLGGGLAFRFYPGRLPRK